ncbi:MAG: TPM domain-containing protein [Candidatus Nanoarchaeia archaeon]
MKNKINCIRPFLRFFLFSIIFLSTFWAVSAQNSAPAIKSYVTDNAGILSPEFKAALEQVMIELESETNGVQFIIYTDRTIPEDYSIEEYALDIAEQNGVGRAGSDNGLLLYIAVDDRQYRWETGYGMESTLNSALLGRISREHMEPEFKQGNYEQGIFNVVNTTTYIILHSEDADVKKMIEDSKKEPSIDKKKLTRIIIFIIIFVLIIIVISSIKNKNNSSKTNSHSNKMYRNSASNIFTGGFGRGGFGGGSSGGFSGGGGHFGGGGHSGGW